MSGGWEIGDLALCVQDTDVDGIKMLVSCGRIYNVTDVTGDDPSLYENESVSGCILTLAEIYGMSFCSSCFRKIKPDAEPCEEEFTVLIKRMKPVKVKS